MHNICKDPWGDFERFLALAIAPVLLLLLLLLSSFQLRRRTQTDPRLEEIGKKGCRAKRKSKSGRASARLPFPRGRWLCISSLPSSSSIIFRLKSCEMLSWRRFDFDRHGLCIGRGKEPTFPPRNEWPQSPTLQFPLREKNACDKNSLMTWATGYQWSWCVATGRKTYTSPPPVSPLIVFPTDHLPFPLCHAKRNERWRISVGVFLWSSHPPLFSRGRFFLSSWVLGFRVHHPFQGPLTHLCDLEAGYEGVWAPNFGGAAPGFEPRTSWVRSVTITLRGPLSWF